ncbi:bifunctional glycosyltransferase family 2 protein/CDP-glycerol:glycerophosphate glycerophosphotransferase [Actinoplanes sp. N902-109]|uniref:bifunctional glycosyltransferase/CDP-glycerol:glycerophosphate glycerophosphotransferase n=1 Tax=Actinoplanes sp. (strain N902-109) TaxID=649831 RepID=UPI0003293E4A|nr:bifunctional glycosyltransferase family 2 protein/CDP-glycerol:glycerophosphate glycerophosphotransferase [Actinoplanes sp. N902-109]AGL14051.1 CDP-glycerol:poly(glycerophosphate) glycerophosphotransferase [Actinoplanes sp. N902-109]
MTLLSVVLPVYKVQGYLRQCLDSLLEQAFTDFEIVAVDDCSPDNSGAILAEYAARDPRVRVISLAENAGLGRARNAGLEHAIGEYVWFLDSDDWLAQGALTAVADRIADTQPDVLIVGFDRVHWDTRVSGSGATKMLAEAPETFTAEQWPRVFSVLHVAWNKVIRRDLLAKLSFQFEEGWYEDVSFTFPVLAAAERISGLARVCVHYRQRRTGAITRTLGDRHFEIFDHWAHAMTLVDQYTDRAEQLRPVLFQRMMWHYLLVLRNAQRVKKSSRRRFFERMHQDYLRYRPREAAPVSGRAQKLRYKFVEQGAFTSFRLLQQSIRVVKAANKVRKAPLRKAKKLAKRVRQALFRGYYKLHLRRPVDQHLALYAAYWYRGVTCNPAAISRKAAELAPEIRNVWVVSKARVTSVPPGVDYVVAGSRAYYRALARSRYLINNVNWPNFVVKREGTTHVMTHHGTPLKMMGMDQADHPAAAKDQNFHAQMRRADRWDYSITANAHTTIAWDRAYPCRYETLEVGYPRNDRLTAATPGEIASVRAQLGIQPHERVVLYTPTHREWLPLGQQVLDVEALADKLGPDTVLLVRAHYFYVAADHQTQARRGRIVDVSAYPIVEDLYLAADVMMTDYSSAMFDFAVLDRPLVIFAPDWQAYRELRGVYFDLTELPPGELATTFDELVDVFATGAYASAAAATKRARFRERFCYLDDGKAADRAVRRIFATT